jgi:hypothetical protein
MTGHGSIIPSSRRRPPHFERQPSLNSREEPSPETAGHLPRRESKGPAPKKSTGYPRTLDAGETSPPERSSRVSVWGQIAYRRMHGRGAGGSDPRL